MFTENLTADDKKDFIWIIVYGGIGGAGSAVYSITLGTPPAIPIFPWGIFAYALLGMFAGFIGVIFFAGIDTRNAKICLAFSLVCGLAWFPVLSGITALIKQHDEIKLAEAVSLTKNNIEKTASEIKTVADDKLPELKDKLLSYSKQLENISNQAYTVSTRNEAEQGLALVSDAFDELGKKNPSLAEYDIQKFSLNNEYEFKVLLKAKHPGGDPIHKMLPLNALKDDVMMGFKAGVIPFDILIQDKSEDAEKSSGKDKIKEKEKTKH